jgi:hypothetical protein
MAGASEEARYAQLTIRQRVLIRVPRMPVARSLPVPKPVRWEEKKGPKCIPAAALAGAIVTARDRIDLVLRGGKRVRARLDDECRSLDFYSGFYLKPAADGMVCAGRDTFRARSGATCPIGRFRMLEQKR